MSKTTNAPNIMNQPENSPVPQPPGPIAFELLEKPFIAFVIAHSRDFDEATTYLGIRVGALRKRRREYRIPNPPPHHYDGPVLSHEEMFHAFLASLAAAPVQLPATLEVVARSVNVTLAPPGGPIVTVPLSAVLPGVGARARVEG
jgi:hypothetical protein